MADIMLQLSKDTFTGIGSIARLNEDNEFDDLWVVKHRLLNLNMNELVQVGNCPLYVLSNGPFTTLLSYY